MNNTSSNKLIHIICTYAAVLRANIGSGGLFQSIENFFGQASKFILYLLRG